MAWKKLKQLQQVFYSSPLPPPSPPPPQGDGSYNESTQRFLRRVRADCWTGRACRSWNCVKVREWLSFPPSGDLDGEGKVLCWRGGWSYYYGALLSYPFLSPSGEEQRRSAGEVCVVWGWRTTQEIWWSLSYQVFRKNGSKHRLPFRVLLTTYRQDSSLGAVECLWACRNRPARSFSSWHLLPGPSVKLLSYHCLQHITHRVQRIPVQWMND